VAEKNEGKEHNKRLQLYELLKELDHAIHQGMPHGGNANIERAQALCNDLRRRIAEDA